MVFLAMDRVSCTENINKGIINSLLVVKKVFI